MTSTWMVVGTRGGVERSWRCRRHELNAVALAAEAQGYVLTYFGELISADNLDARVRAAQGRNEEGSAA